MSDLPHFGSNFLWGVSTAAYQIEGAVDEDGRGRSIWDEFSHSPGRTKDGDTGDVACDHYHRYRDDVALLADLGVDAYRFSISWPRIQPDGVTVEPRGLDFYDRLVDALLERGIEPSATLFHWDSPQALEASGGWENRDIAERFAQYAHVVGERLADRVTRWFTLNETVVFTLLGHGNGIHAPGKELGFGALQVAWHQLLAHGRAVQALRAAGASQVGPANNHTQVRPVDDSDETRDAAHLFDLVYNRAFLDPILLGTWPLAGIVDPVAHDGDLGVIAQPIDFLGVNSYNPQYIAAAAPGGEVPFDQVVPDGFELNDFGWPIIPEGFTQMLVGLKETYGDALPPILITENGGAFNEAPGPDGRVRDQRRIDYTAAHLAALRGAMDAGVDVRGYFHWSLMDNFEWAEGYSQRFGMTYVDYATQQRIPKDSFAWYRSLIAAQHGR
ncbi:beta-glucosidase [Aeromicrobium flavum]|uniref:Beta-glucosidase n=1 Tax=Aeromicrobium flavum TaxID=416568 RepID=A0A512HV25_9ACTN|nr:GH1 family beta-glucosidase [Aeromicrobium flavum]GEO89307.1 beta-glucosidase [Aeromicrobium flavum]